MTLLKAYANKVASYLPKDQRQDLADELFDSLCEQFGDQASEQPELTEKVFLQQQPHPIKLATQMSETDQLHLIGPAYYLSFIETIKITALVIAMVHIALFALSVWTGDRIVQSFLQSALGYPGTLLTAVSIIALIFIALERTGQQLNWLNQWQVNDFISAQAKQPISKGETLFELNVSAIMALWLSGIISLPAVIRHDGVWLTDLTSQLPTLLVSLLIVLLVSDIVIALAKLVRGVWSQSLRVINLTSDVLWIAALAFVLTIDPLVTDIGVDDLANLDDVLRAVNLGIEVGIMIALVVVAWDACTHLWALAHPKQVEMAEPLN